MGIKIVTDSTSDIPPDLARKWDITVVPLNLHFGDQVYKDGIDIDPDEFYERLGSESTLPKTSQPSVGEFKECYQTLLKGNNEIISIHISSKLSGTYNSAAQALQSLGTSVPITVIDSNQASGGLGLIVLSAARMSQQVNSLQEATDIVQKNMEHVKFFGLLNTVEYLVKGGRLSKAQGFFGSMLQIKPILECRDGEIRPLDRIRTRKKAVDRLVEIVRQNDPIDDMSILYTTTPEEAEILRQRLQTLLPGREILIGRIGPIVGTHLGPGALGVSLIKSQ